jgi:hypothetical protein
MSEPEGPSLHSSSGVSTTTRSAAAMHAALGLGFGIGTLVTLQHLARYGELPMTPFGFRSLAGGPFELLDTELFTLLGWSLVAVCAADVLAGIWLWRGRRRGLRLGLATAVPAFGLGVGFALPFLLAGVPIRVALMLAGRRDLR